MNILKIIRSIFIICVLGIILSYYSMKVFGSNRIGVIYGNWYSDQVDEIGVIEPNIDKTISVEIDDDCKTPTGSIDNLKKIINSISDKWSRPLNLEFKITENSNKATINIRILSRNKFKEIQLSDPANSVKFSRDTVIGIVNRDKFNYIGTVKIQNEISPLENIRVYSIFKQTIYLVWDENSDSMYKTSQYDKETWETLLMHEFGHALGYRGHNDNSKFKPLMYSGGNEVIEWRAKQPTKYDIEHLKNVYKLFY